MWEIFQLYSWREHFYKYSVIQVKAGTEKRLVADPHAFMNSNCWWSVTRQTYWPYSLYPVFRSRAPFFHPFFFGGVYLAHLFNFLCCILLVSYAFVLFEDTKGVIRILKSKDRQHNGQKKKYKSTNNDLQTITHKTKDRVTVPAKDHTAINIYMSSPKLSP
jgi:hypothetical protein